MSILSDVQARYAEGAKEVQAELCCPVDYDKNLLEILPQEIIEKDYGCGDPSRYVKQGDTVLDLGCGGGKICYMAAQLVGDRGHVIGVDMTDEMLKLARKYQSDMAEKIGGQRVQFRRGYIQDLALNLAELDVYLKEHPIESADDLVNLDKWKMIQRGERPMIGDNSIDLVISNCVLNLVAEDEKRQLVNEINRVLKPGGRVAISDIVSDEPIPDRLKQDSELWSGCISGAFFEKAFLDAFIDSGFIAVAYDKWDASAWQVVEGIEFRSVTLVAVKADPTPCIDRGHAVIYRGPYSSVADDDDHMYRRGERMAVCERTFKSLTTGPYQEDFIGIAPQELKPPVPWCAPPGTIRPASDTKGGLCQSNTGSDRDSESNGGCC